SMLETCWALGAHVRRRLIEGAADATELFLQELQVRGAEPVDGFSSRVSQDPGRETVGWTEIRRRQIGRGSESGFRVSRIVPPGRADRWGDGNHVELLPFLVCDKARPEGKQEQELILHPEDLGFEAGLRSEAGAGQSLLDPP